MKDISNFSVLLLIFMIIYSLLGMELFAYTVAKDDDGNYPDSTFNTFIDAFISVFIVLANDGWSTIYVNHYRSVGPLKSSLFFITLLMIG